MLIVGSVEGMLGWIDLVDGQLVADPPTLLALADRLLSRGWTEAETYRALDGWSNGYVWLHRQR